MRFNLKSILLAATMLAAGVVAHAQVTTSSLGGRVSDKSGPVAGATVIATYGPTGSTYYAVTNENGNYRINGITPGGPYSVNIEMLGYRKVENQMSMLPSVRRSSWTVSWRTNP